MINLVQANALKQVSRINLYKVHTLDNHLIFISDAYEIQFLGDTYEVIENSISGIGSAEGNEEVRPVWKIGNPNSFLHSIALSNTLEGAQITHYQLQPSLTIPNEFEILSVFMWQLTQIMSVTTELVVQLRTLTDIPAARIPHKGYYPPDYPHVSL